MQSLQLTHLIGWQQVLYQDWNHPHKVLIVLCIVEKDLKEPHFGCIVVLQECVHVDAARWRVASAKLERMTKFGHVTVTHIQFGRTQGAKVHQPAVQIVAGSQQTHFILLQFKTNLRKQGTQSWKLFAYLVKVVRMVDDNV